jgi:hypothetical protein
MIYVNTGQVPCFDIRSRICLITFRKLCNYRYGPRSFRKLTDKTQTMLDYFALILLFFVAIVLFYGIIVIHDIPYEISKKRDHPHQDAIHVAGWISLFTLHTIWPFLWIWATLYRPGRGWGMSGGGADKDKTAALEQELAALRKRVDQLENPAAERMEK